jgi:hypothetical protein
MVYYLTVLQSLFLQIWYWPLLILIIWASYHFSKSKQHTLNVHKTANWPVVLWGFITFVVFSAAYWMFGDNAAHSFSDDVTHTLQTYLSASHRGDSINWTNGLTGGMDRWLLPNCHPLALGRIYALFLLKPHHLYLFIIAINVISVFVFSWKIQTEIWQMRPWAAYIGALVAVIVEGYWTGMYPDAHVSNGHGFAVIIVGVYWLTRFQRSSYLWLVALLVGAFMAIGSWTPFHNLPPLLVTVALWGLVFWGKRAWIKIGIVNALIIAIFIAILLPYFLAIKGLFSTSGRFEVFRPSVELGKIYLWPQIMILIGMGIIGFILKIYQEKLTRKVLIMFLGFSAIPLIAHFLEVSRVMPSFRWQLFYAGNEAWMWLGIVFFMERIQRAVGQLWPIAEVACKTWLISMWSVVLIFVWVNSLWMDLISSYPAGNWHALTETSISTKLKALEPRPTRVVGIDDSNDMHFWGQLQGMESMLGYTPFIDRRKTYFWWYSAMFPSLKGAYTAAFLSIPVPLPGHERNLTTPLSLSFLMNIDALRLSNVSWIISHHPLSPTNDLQLVVNQPGQAAACTDSPPPLSRINFKEMKEYWQNIRCIIKDYDYPRSVYVYHVENALPRVYLARRILPWPLKQIPVLSQPELAMAVQGGAFVDTSHWKMASQQWIGGAVDMDSYQSDYMHLKIIVPQESLVVLSSTLNSYWQVRVNEKKIDSFDVNGFQTGFWVPAGPSQAELVYCPPFRFKNHPRCS